MYAEVVDPGKADESHKGCCWNKRWWNIWDLEGHQIDNGHKSNEQNCSGKIVKESDSDFGTGFGLLTIWCFVWVLMALRI